MYRFIHHRPQAATQHFCFAKATLRVSALLRGAYLHYGVVLSLVPFGKSWRTSRPARHESKVSVLLCILHRRYLAGFLCQGAALHIACTPSSIIAIMVCWNYDDGVPGKTLPILKEKKRPFPYGFSKKTFQKFPHLSQTALNGCTNRALIYALCSCNFCKIKPHKKMQVDTLGLFFGQLLDCPVEKICHHFFVVGFVRSLWCVHSFMLKFL